MRAERSVIIVKLLYFLVMLIAIQNFTAADDEIVVVRNVVYGEHQRQVLDVYLPAGEQEDLPALFVIHGGGYVLGTKTLLVPFAEYFAQRGYAVITPNYRLAGEDPYPAAIEDVFCAWAWTFAHADEYRVDTERMTLIGESAGGNAAVMLAAVDEPERYLETCEYELSEDAKPYALIPYYPYSDLSTCQPDECGLVRYASEIYLGIELEGVNGEGMREAWGEASPLVWIDGSEPPTLIIHGQKDDIVAVSESEALAAALEESGVEVETFYIPEASHGFIEKFDEPGGIEAREAVEAFLEKLSGVSR
jgi:acetyl esterase/lipase